MKDLHIKLSDLQEIYLNELCKYCECSQTKLIETLLQIAYNSAYTQVKISNEFPDKIERELTPEESYQLMHITNIFDWLYPTAEEL